MTKEENDEKMRDRRWMILAAVAQGYCSNPDYTETAYEPLADTIVRTTNAIMDRIKDDHRIKMEEQKQANDRANEDTQG